MLAIELFHIKISFRLFLILTIINLTRREIGILIENVARFIWLFHVNDILSFGFIFVTLSLNVLFTQFKFQMSEFSVFMNRIQCFLWTADFISLEFMQLICMMWQLFFPLLNVFFRRTYDFIFSRLIFRQFYIFTAIYLISAIYLAFCIDEYFWILL